MGSEGYSSHELDDEEIDDYDTEMYSSFDSSYDDEDIDEEDNNNAEDNNNEEGEEVGEGKFREETAINNVEDLLKIKFEELTVEQATKYHFSDVDMAFMFYNRYASKHGFSARKCRIVKSSDGQLLQQTFVCHCEGSKFVRKSNTEVRDSTTVVKKRSTRPNSRCGCEAKVKVHIESSIGRWYIKAFYDVHNHSFLDGNFKGMLPAHRKMSEYDKYQMMLMRDSGIKTSQIYGYVLHPEESERDSSFAQLGRNDNEVAINIY